MDIKRLQSEQPIDYDGFTTLMKRLLIGVWGENWGVFTQDAPSGKDPNNVAFPMITYGIKYMRPGKVGKSTQELKPRHRFTETRATNGNGPVLMSIYGQVMDAEVCFHVWEESNAKVEKKAKEFRDFMNIYKGYFKSQGIREIMFLNMSDQPDNGLYRDNVSCRKLSYLVQFEEFTEMPSDSIRTIEMANQLVLDIETRERIDLNKG